MAAGDLIPTERLVMALAAMAGALIVWWLRERRMARQRKAMRALHALAEEITAAASSGEIVERLAAALPRILRVTSVRLYFFDRAERTLNLVGPAPGEPRISIPVDSSPDSGPALSFRNRTLLAIPDLGRSPVRPAPGGTGPTQSVMFVPMVRKGEVAGVIEAAHATRPREFSADERAAAQHLANQVAAALGLLEQQSLREQVFRSEKLAASGQLISGVASELRAPLEAISDLAARLLRRPAPAGEEEAGAIAREARLAAEIVNRLVSFSRAEGAPRPLDLIELLGNLIEFREREWAARGIGLRNLLPDKPAHVLAIEGQLEQVFLSLLVHAEQSVAGQPDRTVSVGASIMGGKVLVEIAYAQAPGGAARNLFDEGGAVETGALGLAVCRGVLRGLEGDIRFTSAPPLSRIEVTLPLAAPGAEEAVAGENGGTAAPLTLIAVEPDQAVARRLLALLAERGHRAVVVPSGEEAVALIEAFRFDALLCDVRLPGMTWAELFERIRGRMRTCVLLTEGCDADLAREVGQETGLVLSKPVSGAELDRTLRTIAGRAVVE
jgi:signal transduction histidine kinase/CheY-like chemotaxis protein